MSRRAWAAIAAWALAGSLLAGNQESFYLGDDASLKAGAVAAGSAEPSAIYYNPAGLASLQRDSVDLGVSAYAARFYRIPGLVWAHLPDQSRPMDFEGTSFFSTPAAVNFGFRLRPGLGLALAVFTRDQLDLLGVFSASYQGQNAGAPYSYEQGAELDFRAKDYLAGAGLGWSLGRTRVGASVFGEYQRQSLMTRFWGDYIDLNSYNSGTGLYDDRITQSFQQRLAVGTYGLRGVVGLQAELGHGFSLGLVGRSPRFSAYQDLNADILLNGASNFYGALVQVHVNGDAVLHPYVWDDLWRAHAALQWRGGKLGLSAEADASDRPDDAGRGAVWNFKGSASWRFDRAWEAALGAYSDRAWGEPLGGFGSSNMDYHGFNGGLRWVRIIGGGVELSSTLALHYERGTGDFVGTQLSGTSITFPLPELKTNATFEEANVHLSSGLAW